MKKRNFSRRNFMTTAATITAGAGLSSFTPGLLKAQDDNLKEKATNEIIYRQLGKTGIKLPIISMGVMNANNPEVLQASYDLGVRHFDTAEIYQYGQNEQMVGQVINKLGVRDKVTIATKIFHRSTRENVKPENYKTAFIKSFEGSLKRLKTDYVDILYMHSIYGDNAIDDMNDPGIIEAFEELKKQGRIKAAGVSTHRGMALVINNVVEKGFYDVVLTAINISLGSDTNLMRAIDNAHKKGVGIVAMKTQVGGNRLPEPGSANKYTQALINSAVLKWVMKNESITTAIPGYTNYEHMNQNFSVASNLDYTEEEIKFLNDNKIDLSFNYCHQCARCLATCPGNSDIPLLMRTYMYAAQYGNFEKARFTYSQIPNGQNINNCKNCTVCQAQCVNSVNIKNNIEQLKLIYS